MLRSPFGTAGMDSAHRQSPQSFHLPARYRAEWASETHNSTLWRFDLLIGHSTHVVGCASCVAGERERIVRASGAVHVLSEMQARGMLIASTTAAVLPQSHPRRAEVLNVAHELYLGWRRLCENTQSETCQDTQRCGSDLSHECLAGWRWDAAGSTEDGTAHGSAAEGDVDAVFALVLLVLAAEGDTSGGGSIAPHRGTRPHWWEAVMLWTYQSCAAVINYLSEPQDDAMLESSSTVCCAWVMWLWGGARALALVSCAYVRSR